ncbi:D-aminoacyl-tRNA deacylase [Halobacteriaceae archaeon SHR40]|uniref:D-aminoacyl-tRNA deacylase n=1 Tax=Halovenus amylolytica TaxID=2500550 RepID=UPI000FE317F3
MLGIVVSRADSASSHIGEQLLALEDWERDSDDSCEAVYRTDGAELREFEELHLDMARPAEAFGDIDLLVFASRHSGETGALLTAHHTGNFGPADHGGEANELAEACPNAHAAVLDALADHAADGYEVGMECTHHGPSTVGVPSMFVELGSAEPQWQDQAGARAVAQAILDIRDVAAHRERANGDETRRQLVGFGGGHYTPRFERVVRETSWAMGHIAADWGLDAIGEFDDEGQAVLTEAFEQSKAEYAVVDGHHPDVVEAVEEAGYRAVSETWVRETGSVPLAFASAAEEVATVEEGLRFGEPATEYEDRAFVEAAIPTDLLDEACGIDREQCLELFRTRALAFVTAQGGSRPIGKVLLGDESERSALIEELLSVLEERYDSVERNGKTAIARERRFDPEKAKTLGVPKGPAFGRLADGETVEVSGRTIPPEKVQTEREVEFLLE